MEPLFDQSAKNLDFGLIWRQNGLCLQFEKHFGKTAVYVLALIVMNFHAKKQENPWSRLFVNVETTNY